MSGVLLFDADHRHAIAATFRRQIKIHDLGKLFLQQRHEHFVQRDPQHGGFIRRLAGVSGMVDRVTAHGDALYREYREFILFVVVTGVVAERSFQRHLIGVDYTLQYDLGTGRNLQVAAQTFHQFSLAAAQQSGELVFGKTVRHRRDRAEYRGRIGPDHD